jgi:hypothetical protein
MNFTEREVMHIKKIANELNVSNMNIVKIFLNDGSIIEGVVRGATLTPNQYYAVKIETLSRQKFEINYLDIKSLISVWDSKKDEYINAGLLQIAEPKN